MDRDDVNRIRAMLRQWGDCDAVMRWQSQIMMDARAQMESMYLIYRSPSMDGLPKSTVPGNPTERAVERIEACAAMFEETVAQCTAVIRERQAYKDRVSELVRALPRQEREIVTRVYKEHMSMTAAATLTGVSERTGYDREMAALARIAEKIRVD